MPSNTTAFPPMPVVVMLIGIQAPVVTLLTFGVEAWWVDAFAHFIPWLTLGLLIQAAVFRNRILRVFSIAASGALIGLMATAPTAETAASQPFRCEGPQFRISSFNVQYGGHDTVAVAQLFDAQRPDIAFFTEVTPEWDNVLRQVATTRGFTYYSDPDRGLYGSAVMSRPPLADVTFVPHSRSTPARRLALEAGDLNARSAGAPQLRAIVRAGNETFAIGGAHLSFPLMPSTHAQALQETDQIAAWARDRMTDPSLAGVLLVGDFNSTPFSAILRRLHASTGLTTVVPLWPGTWPADLPVGIAIDHVFASGRLRVESVTVGGDLGSDHRPVSAGIMIEPARCPGD